MLRWRVPSCVLDAPLQYPDRIDPDPQGLRFGADRIDIGFSLGRRFHSIFKRVQLDGDIALNSFRLALFPRKPDGRQDHIQIRNMGNIPNPIDFLNMFGRRQLSWPVDDNYLGR